MIFRNLSHTLVGILASFRRYIGQIQLKLALTSAIAVIDYGLVSVTKFFISVYLGRTSAPSEFGIFVLAYNFLVLYNSVQAGFIGESITVLAAPLKDEDFAKHLVTAALFLLSLAAAIGVLMFGIVLIMKPSLDQTAFSCYLNLSWVSIVVVAQDFFRRVLYSRLQSLSVLVNDLLLAGIQVSGLFYLVGHGLLSANRAIIVVGAGSALATILGLIQARQLVNLSLMAFRPSFAVLHRLWNYGRWSFGAQVAFNFSTQGYLYAAGIMLGTAAAGALKACQNIISPIQIFLVGLDSLFMAVGSARYQRGGLKALNALLWIVGIFFLLFTTPYVVGMSIYAKPVLDWLYKGQYTEFYRIVFFYGLYQLAFAASRPFVLGLRSLQRPVRIFQGYLVVSILTMSGLYPLVRFFGVNGAAFGTSLTEIAFLIFVFIMFLYQKRQQPKEQEVLHEAF